MAISQVGAVIGRVLWGYASDRWFGARRMLALLASLMAVASLATAWLHSEMPRLVVIAVLFVFGAVLWRGTRG